MPFSTQDRWLTNKFTWKDLFLQTGLWQKLCPWPDSLAPIHHPLRFSAPGEEAIMEWGTISTQILPHQTGLQFSVEEDLFITSPGTHLPYHTHQSLASWEGQNTIRTGNGWLRWWSLQKHLLLNNLLSLHTPRHSLFRGMIRSWFSAFLRNIQAMICGS